MSLKGKTAIVTGATRGLGRAIAEAYLAEGADVMFAAREPGELPEGGPGRAAFHPVDVTRPESVAELVEATVAEFGGVDVFVANAGVNRPGPISKLAVQDWTDTLHTNVTGLFHCTQAAVPALAARGGGRIIAMSSALATRVTPGAAAYSASKAAIETFVRIAAVELAPRKILVNCLSPGIIDAGMGKALQANETVWSRFSAKLASGRPGTSAEVARAAVFLAGDDSSYVSGHSLEVNGALDW